jgi:hypothetical protein
MEYCKRIRLTVMSTGLAGIVALSGCNKSDNKPNISYEQIQRIEEINQDKTKIEEPLTYDEFVQGYKDNKWFNELKKDEKQIFYEAHANQEIFKQKYFSKEQMEKYEKLDITKLNGDLEKKIIENIQSTSENVNLNDPDSPERLILFYVLENFHFPAAR